MDTGIVIVVSTCDGNEFEMLFAVCASGIRIMLWNISEAVTLFSMH